MRKPALPFKWLLAATGVWLALSPFVLFSPETLQRGMVDQEVLAFVVIGILALIMSGADGRSHLLARVTPVTAIGVFLIAVPVLLSDAIHIVTAANAWLTGSVLIVLAIWEVLASRRLRAIS